MKLSTQEAVRAAMLKKLADSLLDEADAKKLLFKPLTADQVKQLDVPASVSGFIIPYFSVDGKPTKFWRLRYLEDTRKGFDILSGRKPLRYVQSAGGVNEVYLAPFSDWKMLLENVDVPLVITEGELKAACSCKVGIPAIGLGGVWCFKSNHNKMAMLPSLLKFRWKERTVIICYDSDAVTNPQVVMAENWLAQELTNMGAHVKIARLPPNDDGTKVGIDDYLLTHAPTELLHLLEEASSFEMCGALHAMNELVAYIKNPGLIYSFKDEMRMRATDFTGHAFAHHWYEDKTGEKVIRKPTAVAWLRWEHRNQLNEITFMPGKPDIHDGKLNTWRGWPLTPKKGSVALWKQLLDHLFEETEPEARKWFEQWCAYPMQNPGAKMASAACFWGKEHGSGKTLIGHTLMRIYGKNSCEIRDKEIEDDRGDWAENMQFALADDITGNNNRQLANRLKTMITQKTLKINPKFIPRYTVPDCINYYFTSNDPDAFYLDDGDRRFFVHEVKAEKLPVDLRTAFVDWRDSDEGASALFHYLLSVDLTGFDPFAEAFQTQAKEDMTLLTKSDVGSWVAELKSTQGGILKLPGDLFTAAEIRAAYDPMNVGKVTANGMARELKRAGFRAPGSGSMVMTKFGGVRLYVIRNRDDWKKKKPKEIAAHYESSRSMEPSKKSKVKF